MCFNLRKMLRIKKFFWRKTLIFWILLSLLGGGSLAQERVIERVLAIVEGEIITLTDVQVALTFGLFSLEEGKTGTEALGQILDKLIEVKVVLKLAESKKVDLPAEVLDKSWAELKNKLGEERYQRLKKVFGLSDKDIRRLLREKLIFDQIIQKRITLIIPVSLDEIREYYQNVYLKEMADRQQEPRSLVEVMRELEVKIRREKGQAEVGKWLQTFRSQADIVIKAKEMIDYY